MPLGSRRRRTTGRTLPLGSLRQRTTGDLSQQEFLDVLVGTEGATRWEAFFLIGIWEMWRVESGWCISGYNSCGCNWRWSGSVRAGSEPFEPQTGPQTGPKRPRRDGVKHRSALRRVRCLLSGGSGLLLIRASLKDNCTHSRPCFCLRLPWPGGTRFVADGHTVSNAPDLF